MQLINRTVTTLALFVFSLSTSQADIHLPPIFSEGMILQREISNPIWGTAEPGEKIVVRIEDQLKTTTADQDGHWLVKLDPLKTGEPRILTITGKNQIKLKDVLFGDVWLASGQSNMELPMYKTSEVEEEIAAVGKGNPLLRAFKMKVKYSTAPVRDFEGQWEILSDKHLMLKNWSGVAYYFGREIQREEKIPVGILMVYKGSSTAEAWTPESVLKGGSDYSDFMDKDWDKLIEDYKKKNDEQNKAYEEAVKADKNAKKPKQLTNPEPLRPSGLYNGMIAPLVSFGIKGVIWYQGEGNASRAKQYKTLFPAMIKSWRDAWAQGDFPFYFVQLPNYGKANDKPIDGDWPELREAQASTLSVTNTGMAVTIDIGGEPLHPPNKKDVGIRLSKVAEALTYGKKIEYSGPVYEKHEVEGANIRVYFTHAEGLHTKSKSNPEGNDFVKAFAIAGEDQQWKTATAKIDGTSVLVWSDEVKNPVAVRYAWKTNPDVNLYNSAELPAAPFRTDDWEFVKPAPKK